jgi:hypothetical protein
LESQFGKVTTEKEKEEEEEKYEGFPRPGGDFVAPVNRSASTYSSRFCRNWSLNYSVLVYLLTEHTGTVGLSTKL